MLPLPAPYRLRPMALADIPAVLEIDRASFPSPAPEQLFINELTDNQLAHYQVLARGEGASEKLIGFAGFWLIAGEVHISTIAVAPAERGRGRGEWLLLNLLWLACALDPLLITLEVRRGNAVAQALYAKYRFEEVGVRRRYYRDTGEDALLLTVDLAAQPDYCAWLAQKGAGLRTDGPGSV
ncbi:MAG: ribosomal protein S18-alanine N-acetyltransferase [Candidatus Promineofilum sp.]|nr:ribosomal protein S18-alanine N-acetyltransferase [Promineifilum sp.]